MPSFESGYGYTGTNEKKPDKKTCEDALYAALNPDTCEPVAITESIKDEEYESLQSLETGSIDPNKKTLEDDLHAALNPDTHEPVVGTEEIVDEGSESPQGPEVGFINPNTIIDREKSLSERLQGSARKAAKVMALITALSALSGFSPDAEAREYRNYKDSVRTEQVDKTEVQKSERMQLTKASKWAGEKVKSAQNDLPHIKNAQDAEWLVKLHMDGFADDFYSGPRNSSGRIMYNTERVYTMDDARYAIECAKTLKGIMEDLQGRYGVGNYEERQARLDKVISNLEQQTSYSFQKEQEARRDMIKHFKFHKYR